MRLSAFHESCVPSVRVDLLNKSSIRETTSRIQKRACTTSSERSGPHGADWDTLKKPAISHKRAKGGDAYVLNKIRQSAPL